MPDPIIPRFTEVHDDGTELFIVDGPDLIRDKLVPLNTEGARQMGARLGKAPSRSSMNRWRRYGYPIDRNGPRVRLPCVVQLKQVYTSTAALSRWFQVIQHVGTEIRDAGSVDGWRSKRNGGAKQ